MEHRCGTFFSGIYVYASRISIADRGTAEAVAQQQQHSSSGGHDVAVTDEKDERGYTGEPFVFVLALSRNLKRTSADTPQSLSLTTAVLLYLADKCAAAVIFLKSVLYTSIARSLPCYYYCCCRAVFDY